MKQFGKCKRVAIMQSDGGDDVLVLTFGYGQSKTVEHFKYSKCVPQPLPMPILNLLPATKNESPEEETYLIDFDTDPSMAWEDQQDTVDICEL